MSTSASTKFSVGDYITDFENIYKIFGKQIASDYHHQKCTYLLYRPIDPAKKNQATFSIPIDNVQKSGLRHPINSEHIKEIYSILKKPLKSPDYIDPKTIKEILYQNDPLKTVFVLKQLVVSKKELGEKFPKNLQELITNITEHLSAEIAFVSKKSLESVQKEIQKLTK